jgi:hypothetical protein
MNLSARTLAAILLLAVTASYHLHAKPVILSVGETLEDVMEKLGEPSSSLFTKDESTGTYRCPGREADACWKSYRLVGQDTVTTFATLLFRHSSYTGDNTFYGFKLVGYYLGASIGCRVPDDWTGRLVYKDEFWFVERMREGKVLLRKFGEVPGER